MKLASAQENPAILSNVGEIGEFRIRNSAKAFNILSSGLYANKIRAIIRELSCNAVDSHVAAGKSSTPFDVHLPNQLEPWFAIRDYGTGLSHDQVTNIYTTYFESTKTESNDYIGALGLGSKSPFSYTDNFTVTAVQNGRRGIYSAFINDQGVPSIALMMEEETNEPNGVEVKFSVNSNSDFHKFVQEAREVYTYFKLRPVINGAPGWVFNDAQYVDKDVVPGVHVLSNGHPSRAVMGNIAYKIDVPNAEKNLGKLSALLNCSLEMHFEIGELDFQASREGLSYIQSTIDAIKSKLEQLNAVLLTKLADEANKLDNLWDRALFLTKKKEIQLWRAAVHDYVTKNAIPTLDPQRGHGYLYPTRFELFDDELARDYNLTLRGFSKSHGYRTVSNIRKSSNWDSKDSNGNPISRVYLALQVSNNLVFVKNDLKTGAFARTRQYMQVNVTGDKNASYVVMSAADSTKPAKYDEFLASIHNPPKVESASSYPAKVREQSAARGTNVSIMRLERRDTGWGRGRYDDSMVWRPAGELGDLNDANQVYYYLPLNGFQTVSQFGEMCNNKSFYQDVIRSGIDGLREITLYGVRKADLAAVKSHKNWVNIEEHLNQLLPKIAAKIEMNLVRERVNHNWLWTKAGVTDGIKDQSNLFVGMADNFKGLKIQSFNYHAIAHFYDRYLKKELDLDAITGKLNKQAHKVIKQYPLLPYLESASVEELAEYVNMVDQVKK